MAKRSVEESTLTALGNAIRRKTGTAGALTPDGGMIAALETLEDIPVRTVTRLDTANAVWKRGLLEPFSDNIAGASSYGLYTITFAPLCQFKGDAALISLAAPEGCEMRISIVDNSTGTSVKGYYVKWTDGGSFDVSACGDHSVCLSLRRIDNAELSDEEAQALAAALVATVTTGLTGLTADQPETAGQLSCLSRIRQMRDIVYTPVAAMPYNGGTYPAGEPVTGLPYSSVRKTDKFIGFNVSLDTFMTAIHNPNSVLYTKESTESHAKTWYGTNCSTFVSYVYGWDYHNATAIFAAMDCTEEIAVADMRLCDAANKIDEGANGGHVVIISGIVRDAQGNIITVEISESDGTSVSCTSMPYEAFLYDYIGLQGYKMYRNTDLYKANYVPSEYVRLFDDEPEQAVTYSDICTDLGDKATILTSETITLHPLKTDGYTAIKLYRDGVEVGSYDVGNVELSGLAAGKYSARLYPEGDNASTSFIVCEAAVAQENRRYTFSGTGGTPVRVVFKNSTGFTLHAVDLTERDIENGYVDIDYSNESAANVCVPFRNDYGFVVAQCSYVLPVDTPEALLPAEYQQVDYIETDGSQYIDTGVLASDHFGGIRYVMSCNVAQSLSTSNNWYWGALADSKRAGNISYVSGTNLRLFAGGANACLRWIGDLVGINATIDITAVSTAPESAVGTVNGEAMSAMSDYTATDMPAANIYLMRCNGASSGSWFCGKLYSFAMDTADGTPIRNFVPCYRVADGVIGLYDTVEGIFYTNAGTSSFTKGADV